MDEMTRNRQALAEQILDRLANDEEFRKELLDNPDETLEKLGFTPSEVTGYGLEGSSPTTGILCTPDPIQGTTAIACPTPGVGGGGHASTALMCTPTGGGTSVTAPPPGPGTTAIMCPTPPKATP